MLSFARPSPALDLPGPSLSAGPRMGGLGNAAMVEDFGLGVENTIAPTTQVAPAVEGPIRGGMLRRGSQGEDVVRAQRQLNLHGADLVEDGIFGALTDAATRQFQAEQGLAADGIIGPLTWAALGTGLGPAAVPARPDHQTVSPGGPSPADRELDEVHFTIQSITADSSEFDAFVSMGALDIDLAATLSGMRDLGGESFFSYLTAKQGLADGSLLGIVHSRGLPALLQRRLPPGDPDRALFSAVRPTSTGAVFQPSQDGKRGVIVVADGHSYGSRSEALSIAHELNHFTNRGPARDAVAADASHDIVGVSHNLTPDQIGETRRIFVHEVVARHVEWWVAQEIRADRLGQDPSTITPPVPGALLGDCITFAQEAVYSNGIYDPHGYWALLEKDPQAFEDQVRGWMNIVVHESFSGNPYTDMIAKATFLAGSVSTPLQPGDGLDGDI